MKPQGTSAGSLLFHPVLRLMAAATFADLGALLLVLIAHAATGSDVLLKPALFLTVALALLSATALLIGAVYAWAAYPQHRRALVFVVLVTGLTLLAHLYVISVPAATQGAVLSGAVGSTLQDQQIRVNSSIIGSALAVSVHVSGGNPVADLQVSADGVPLRGAWSGPTPTYSSPLAAGASLHGNWSVLVPPSQVSVSYQTLICYDQSTGVYGCIMDEVFYVPEAQGILTGQHCSTSAPNCHMEHPPLSPALEAAGMALFGEYNAAGWRAMPVLLGTFSLPLLFGIAWRLSDDKKVGYFAMALLGLDVMFFSHSGAALLDVPMVFFGLLALFVLVWDVKFWRIDKYILSGVILALAGLSKETAVFLALGLFTYNLLLGEGSRRKRILTTLEMAVVLAIVFAAGLQTYDSVLATPAVPTFVDQVRYMLSYGSSLIANQLACQPTTGYWCKFMNDPGGAPILPTDWLLYYTPVGYYATSVTVCPNTVNGVCQGGQYSYVSVAYYG
ncbi:MAG TPA: glycosyltransferase family 39 protein, partial [Nitrososphaerales archaeon]|nr:glycosyltransferase family 39 protein [Nitrososphaerales archaeon]